MRESARALFSYMERKYFINGGHSQEVLVTVPQFRRKNVSSDSRASERNDLRPKATAMKSSNSLPANVLIAPRRRIAFWRLTEFEASWSYRLTTIGLLLWWIAYLYPLIAVNAVEESFPWAAEATAEGSLTNRLLVFSFAILGGIYLPHAIRALRQRREAQWLSYVLAAYLLWSALTIFWSIDVALSVRRLGVLFLLLIGAMGLGAGFYGQTRDRALTIGRHVLYASWIAVAMLIASRLWHRSISELLDPEWTLKYDTESQYYMFAAAYGVISALVLYSSAKTKRVVSVLLLALVLLLLKGRTMIAGTLAASLLILSLLAKRGWWRRTTFLLGLILSSVQIDLATGGRIVLSCVAFVNDSLAAWLPYLTIGNGMKDLLSLSGRIPLWHTLWPYFLDHPFVGHGFGAFWYPNRFYDIHHEVVWPAVVAHNGFLDELLGTGVIGLVLFLVLWFAGTQFTLRLAKEDKRTGYLVFGWLLLFLFCNSMGSILQSYFQAPTFFSVTALFAALAQPARHASVGYRRCVAQK
jgi:exopolysaccharide production protein ExoQ